MENILVPFSLQFWLPLVDSACTSLAMFFFSQRQQMTLKFANANVLNLHSSA